MQKNIEQNLTSLYELEQLKLAAKGNYNTVQTIYENSIINVNGEKLNTFLLSSVTRKECPVLPLLPNTDTEVLTRTIEILKM